MPCRLCLPEQYGVSAAIRSIGSSVPSRNTNAFARTVSITSARVGAREAKTSMASRMYRKTVATPIANPAASWA